MRPRSRVFAREKVNKKVNGEKQISFNFGFEPEAVVKT